MEAEAVHELIPMSQLRAGQTGEVQQLMGRADQVHRLEELGLRIGTMIEVIRSGSPCIVRVGGKQYGFRATELLKVLVKPGVAV